MNDQFEIESPCVDFCKLDCQTDFCLGCFRHIDEIVSWSTLNNDDKLTVIAEAEKRKLKFQSGGKV